MSHTEECPKCGHSSSGFVIPQSGIMEECESRNQETISEKRWKKVS